MTPEMYIRNEIEDRGIKLTALSNKTGITYQRLQTCVRGLRNMRIDEYLALCSLFNLDPRGYLKENDNATDE